MSRVIWATRVSSDIIYSRKLGWMPFVVKRDGVLYLELGAGATANHDPRTFTIPITEDHLEVIKTDFIRHMLLWVAILPLCDAVGTTGPIDEAAAVALCDAILFGSEADIEALFKEVKWYDGQLIAHHADPRLLEKGEIFAATKTLTEESNWKLTEEYHANRQRAQRGVYLTPLDAAVLKYTNQYLHGGGVPSRHPEAVEPEFLPDVLAIVATAEEACAGMELPKDYGVNAGRHDTDKQAWDAIHDTAVRALRSTYPDLADDTVATVSFLMCAEAANRVRKQRKTQ